MSTEVFRYRTNDGAKIVISISEAIRSSDSRSFVVNFTIRGHNDEEYSHTLEMTSKFVKSMGADPDEVATVRSNIRLACKNIILDLILNGHLLTTNSEVIKFQSGNVDKRISGSIIVQPKSRVWIYKQSTYSLIRENQMARRLVLEHAYLLSSQGGDFNIGNLERECHYNNHIVSNAIKYMETAGFFVRHPSQDPMRSLSEKGQLEFERTFLRFSNSVFLIAACKLDIIELIKTVYKPIVEGEFGLSLIFQEAEEPHKSIHEDIYDYLPEESFNIFENIKK